MSLKILAKSWLPVFVWMAFITIFSGDLMSSAHTSRFLIPFLRWLKPDITGATLLLIHGLVRKGAHLFVYAVLAFLLTRALKNGTQLRQSVSLVAIAWLGSTMFAVLDEFHQFFVPSRSAAVGDVVIDSIGALLGAMIYWLFRGRIIARP